MDIPVIFSNWSGSVRTQPHTFLQPATIAEVQHLVRTARGSVRPVGAGHSFTPVAAGTETMVNLDKLSGIVSVDTDRKRVRFLAGTRLRTVPGLLAPFGLAFANQGDVDPQSLAGAVSTSTHGTGLDFTGFAGTVTALSLIDAAGQRRDYSLDENPELLRLITVSVGALGIIVEVEMQCVDAFDLVAEEVGDDFDEILDNWETHARSADHLECFWFPHTDRAQIKRNTRLTPDAAHEVGPRPKWKEFLDEELVGNGAFAAALAVGRAVPASIPYANRIATAALSHNRYRGTNHGVFVSPRRVRFHEMEYAVPLAEGPAVVREIRSLIDRRGWRIGLPLELRTTAADDVALSTSTGRESMYIATHVPQFVDPQPIFAEIEPLLRSAGGRPHWGKMHTLARADLAELYPRFDEFCALREQMDPQWRFGSNYLKKLFG